MITANPLLEQLWAVLYAAGAGVLYGCVYDLFRSIRWGTGRRWIEFLLDAVFSVFAASVLFLLITSVAQLRLRGFILLSVGAGWLLWNLTAGKIFRRLLQQARRFLIWLFPAPRRSEKLVKKQKKCFPFCLSWYKIKEIMIRDKGGTQ